MAEELTQAKILSYLGSCKSKSVLKSVLQAAQDRLHFLEHDDPYGAGKKTGWKDVPEPGSVRPHEGE